MINLGIERTTRLLQQIAQKCFQQPQFLPAWKAAHIAGTNGKGSVAAYLSALLRKSEAHNAAGLPLRIGRFTSPHFIDRWDCIRINDEPISKEEFLQTEHQVKKIAYELEEELRNEATRSKILASSLEEAERNARVTEFEILTATAFALFSQPNPRPCDIAVIECGLGGLLDATNALPDSTIAVSIITRIGLDHLDMLGGSLETIVREKCGIFRTGVPVVIDGDNDPEVLEMIRGQCMQKASAQALRDWFPEAKAADLSSMLESSAKLSELMPHQRSNLAVAVHAFKTVKRSRLLWMPQNADCLTATLFESIISEASQSYPARLQFFQHGWLDSAPGVYKSLRVNHLPAILDGTHNPQSAQVLRQFVDRAIRRDTLTLSVSSNKDKEEPTYTSTITNLDHYAQRNDGGGLATGTTAKADESPEHQSGGTPKLVCWILALSSTKPPAEILATLFQHSDSDADTHNRTRIIFTSFGPVDGMPWVKAAPPEDLFACATEMGLGTLLEAPTRSISEALQEVERIVNDKEYRRYEPLLVIAGSLYLAGDFLRFIRYR